MHRALQQHQNPVAPSRRPPMSRQELIRGCCALSLGSNLEPERHLPAALRSLRSLGRFEAVSGVYLTTPMGPVAQPDFHNLAVLLSTDLSPLDLLGHCQSVEERHGRTRLVPLGPRTLDIDLLFWQPPVIVEHPRLRLPHPRLAERAFVLTPLLELEGMLPASLSRRLREASRATSDQGVRRLGEIVEVYSLPIEG